MPTYVVRLSHSSDQCPSANSKVRDRIQEKAPEIPKIAERLGLKMLGEPLVMGAEHESVAIVEADRVETVNDFLLETGMIQWNTARVSMAQPLSEALSQLEKVPAPLY